LTGSSSAQELEKNIDRADLVPVVSYRDVSDIRTFYTDIAESPDNAAYSNAVHVQPALSSSLYRERSVSALMGSRQAGRQADPLIGGASGYGHMPEAQIQDGGGFHAHVMKITAVCPPPREMRQGRANRRRNQTWGSEEEEEGANLYQDLPQIRRIRVIQERPASVWETIHMAFVAVVSWLTKRPGLLWLLTGFLLIKFWSTVSACLSQSWAFLSLLHTAWILGQLWPMCRSNPNWCFPAILFFATIISQLVITGTLCLYQSPYLFVLLFDLGILGQLMSGGHSWLGQNGSLLVVLLPVWILNLLPWTEASVWLSQNWPYLTLFHTASILAQLWYTGHSWLSIIGQFLIPMLIAWFLLQRCSELRAQGWHFLFLVMSAWILIQPLYTNLFCGPEVFIPYYSITST
jgi:hypothetical protein